MDTTGCILLQNGSCGYVQPTMTYGEAGIILLLAAILFVQIVWFWMWVGGRHDRPDNNVSNSGYIRNRS